jgi:hypothetical protein
MAKTVGFWTVPQVCQVARVTDAVVHRAIKNGELKTINERDPKKLKFFARVEPAEAKRWIEERFGKKKQQLPLLENVPVMPIPTGPGRLTSIDDKLDAIQRDLALLIKLWS